VRAPDITYGFSVAKDTAGPTFEIFHAIDQRSGGVSVDEFVQTGLAKDRALVLTNATVTANPGSSQLVVEMKIQIVTHTGVIVDLQVDTLNRTGGDDAFMNWQGEVYLLGGGDGADFLRSFAQYSSVTVANTTTVSWSGVVVPRGNIAAR